MKPKKALGQNFLTSIPARVAIVQAGDLHKDEEVLEIGPGKGFLTKELLKTGARVTALEKDRDLIPVLMEEFRGLPNFKLLEGDALAYDPPNSGYKLIANIPYYITGAILERYLSHTNQPDRMVVLVQKEVAERACAKDGKESILSLSIKVYGEPKLVYRVSRGSFNPIPTVDSAVLQISSISRNNFKNQYHEGVFFKAIKAGFAHKRKFVLSNLKEAFPKENLEHIFTEQGISPKTRAEDLPVSSWLSLSSSLS